MKKKYQPPKENTGDTAHLVVSGIASIIPGAAELLQYFITPPIDNRRQKWMEEVGEALRELETKRGVNLEDLQENEEFLDTLLRASQAAIMTSQREKHEALRNAICNAALANAPEEDIQVMFLRLIERNTTWHIRILKLYKDPWEWGIQNNIEYPKTVQEIHLIEFHFPELIGKREFYELICNDLYSQGLTPVAKGTYLRKEKTIPNELTYEQFLQAHLSPRITQLGKMFLEYIENPFENK